MKTMTPITRTATTKKARGRLKTQRHSRQGFSSGNCGRLQSLQ